MAEPVTVSAVISTFQRPEACERAVRSVLAQTAPPVEVLVCDDGSLDDTAERMRAWEQRDGRVRYLRVEPNSGTPAAPRNLGIEQARGEWIAFLDDDDEWLPQKLERQATLFGQADVIGTNARRSDGTAYFADAPAVSFPTRREMLRANPLIMPSVMARRASLLAAGGFRTERWARAVADYAMWLALADHGARIAALGEVLVRYADAPADRMSDHRTRSELSVARLMWDRARRRPTFAEVVAAAWHTAVAGAVAVEDGPLRGRRR
jgi:teichuronic acid biosynthesis glycosyltransferase TuaG